MAELVAFLLGPVEFSLSAGSINDLQRLIRWNVDQAAVIEGIGVPHSRGRGSDQITLQGVVFPGQVGSLDSVRRLRDLGDAGEPAELVDGAGNSYGRFVVTALREKKGPFFVDGVERRAEWQMTLTHYPEGA